ncbi:MAG: hypothetical protein JW761_05385 [Prolixibacteraceae bacterium]|nr:hypothetical protein [Prolixibacteraceae bacterium]
MFITGIFSTHIPYIAFLLFYAYFFVAGVNKAVSGEFPAEENFCKTEIYASDTFTASDIDTYHFFSKVSDCSGLGKYEDFLFKQKINYPGYSDSEFNPEFCFETLFCRPPPAA